MAGKGARAKAVDLGRWTLPVRTLMLGYVLVSTMLPIVALVLVSLNGYWTPNIAWDRLSLT